MAITPKLLTSEASAHYPRLWGLVEALSHNRHTRKYPIMLDIISFTQQFEDWILVSTQHIADTLNEPAPDRSGRWKHYGADPLVAERLDYFADNIGAFIAKNETIGMQMIYDLGDWHKAILMHTSPAHTPRYMVSIKCSMCNEYSVLKHDHDYFCVNKECQHSWIK